MTCVKKLVIAVTLLCAIPTHTAKAINSEKVAGIATATFALCYQGGAVFAAGSALYYLFLKLQIPTSEQEAQERARKASLAARALAIGLGIGACGLLGSIIMFPFCFTPHRC